MPSPQKPRIDLSRRRFLKRSSLALAGAAAHFSLVNKAHAATSTEIRIGLIGCGGRGTGAVFDALGAATQVIYPRAGFHTEDVAEGASVEHKDITVVALADLFEDRLTNCRKQLDKLGIAVPKSACFTGFDAYQHLLAISDVNYVILATPPHFRANTRKRPSTRASTCSWKSRWRLTFRA